MKASRTIELQKAFPTKLPRLLYYRLTLTANRFETTRSGRVTTVTRFGSRDALFVPELVATGSSSVHRDA